MHVVFLLSTLLVAFALASEAGWAPRLVGLFIAPVVAFLIAHFANGAILDCHEECQADGTGPFFFEVVVMCCWFLGTSSGFFAGILYRAWHRDQEPDA